MTVHSPLVENCGLKIWLFPSNFERVIFFFLILLYHNFLNGVKFSKWISKFDIQFQILEMFQLVCKICRYETLPSVARVRKIWLFLSNFRSSSIRRWIKSLIPSSIKSQLAAHSLSSLQLGYMPARRCRIREHLTYHVKFSSAWNF